MVRDAMLRIAPHQHRDRRRAEVTVLDLLDAFSDSSSISACLLD